MTDTKHFGKGGWIHLSSIWIIANCNDEIQKPALVPKQGKTKRFCVWFIKKNYQPAAFALFSSSFFINQYAHTGVDGVTLWFPTPWRPPRPPPFWLVRWELLGRPENSPWFLNSFLPKPRPPPNLPRPRKPSPRKPPLPEGCLPLPLSLTRIRLKETKRAWSTYIL